LDSFIQLIELNRFEYHEVNVTPLHIIHNLFFALAGYHYDWRVSANLFDKCSQLPAVSAGHFAIGDNEVEGILAKLFETLGTAAGCRHLVVHFRQCSMKKVTYHGIVIYHQDLLFALKVLIGAIILNSSKVDIIIFRPFYKKD
jgi:hypothetical protein